MQAAYIRNDKAVAQLRCKRIKAFRARFQEKVGGHYADRCGSAGAPAVSRRRNPRFFCGFQVAQQGLQHAAVHHGLCNAWHAFRIERARVHGMERIVQNGDARRGNHLAFLPRKQ